MGVQEESVQILEQKTPMLGTCSCFYARFKVMNLQVRKVASVVKTHITNASNVSGVSFGKKLANSIFMDMFSNFGRDRNDLFCGDMLDKHLIQFSHVCVY